MVNANCEIIICAGSGGVGKTTLSCSIAINEAKKGRNVLVLTIDPAQRLATALGLSQKSLQVIKVPDQNYKGTLFASMIDPHKEFINFVVKGFKNQDNANKLINNRLFKQLSTSLSGSQEFTSINCLLSAAESGLYDLVILDTPPAQHALDFLGAPEKIYKLFQGKLIDWFVKPVESQSLMRKIINRGTETVLKVLHMITGSQFMEELAGFFESIGEVKDKIRERSVKAEQLLASDKTSFVLVTSHGTVKLMEAENFIAELKNFNFKLKTLIINRAFPFYLEFPKNNENNCSEELKDLLKQIEIYNSERLKKYKDFQSRIKADIETILLPEYSQEVVGLKELENLGNFLREHSGSE